MMRNEPRFALLSRETALDTAVSEHNTFTEADTYMKELGRTGKHIDLYILDKSRNVLADASDEEEAEKLSKALNLESKRKVLMDIQEENLKRAEELKSRQANLSAVSPEVK